MKALILKDMYVLLNQKKMLISLISLFVIIAFYFNDPGLLLTFLTVLCIVQINSTLTFDETSMWNRFANTLPIKRADIVKSKYVFGLLLIVLLVAISLPVFLITNVISKAFTFGEILSLFCFIISGLLFAIAFILPVFIKFGLQTGRIILVATVFIPFIFFNVLSNGTFLNELFEMLTLISVFLPLFSIIMLYISFKLTVNLYEKKEF